MKKKLLKGIYIIPIVGLIIAIIWLIIDIEYVNDTLDAKHTFYIGMINHVFVGCTIGLILVSLLFKV